MKKNPRVIIFMESGLVSDVVSEVPIDVTIVDYDNGHISEAVEIEQPVTVRLSFWGGGAVSAHG